MRDVVKQRRILLKEWFRAEDPRREEAVTEVRWENEYINERCRECQQAQPKGFQEEPHVMRIAETGIHMRSMGINRGYNFVSTCSRL